MYRFVIEHPHWIPEADLAKIDVRAGHSMGRIYRVRASQSELRNWVHLNELDTTGLVSALDSANGWQRDMAMQTLVWNDDKSAIPKLREMIRACSRAESRLQALCTLDQLQGVRSEDLEVALQDQHPGVRRHAVRISDSFGQLANADHSTIAKRILALARDDDAQVRLQVACSLGNWPSPGAANAMLELAMKDPDDQIMMTGVLSSLNRHNTSAFVNALLQSNDAASKRNNLIKRVIPSALEWGGQATEVDLVQYVVVPTETAGVMFTGRSCLRFWKRWIKARFPTKPPPTRHRQPCWTKSSKRRGSFRSMAASTNRHA